MKSYEDKICVGIIVYKVITTQTLYCGSLFNHGKKAPPNQRKRLQDILSGVLIVSFLLTLNL